MTLSARFFIVLIVSFIRKMTERKRALLEFEEEQIFVIWPSDDSCGSFLDGAKAGNERNDAITAAIRHEFMLSYKAFKHTQMLVRSKKPFLTLNFST